MEAAGFDLSVQQRWLLTSASAEDREAQARCSVVIDGDLAPESLHAALTALVARHEILRTRFEVPIGLSIPVQVIDDAADVDWDGSVDAQLHASLTQVDGAAVLTLSASAAIADAATLTALAT